MNSITVTAGQRSGCVTAPASKSCVHRLLICAALSEKHAAFDCGHISKDIAATKLCLDALMSAQAGESAVLFCGESGSTLRFLLPLCGALGKSAVFRAEGRLSERPLAPLCEALSAHGMTVCKHGKDIICSGRLQSGVFEIRGDISSQFISGLLFALPLSDGDSVIRIAGKTVSRPYIEMTENALTRSGIRLERGDNGYRIPGGQTYSLSDSSVEGDWSNAAFFLCMGAVSDKGVTVKGLSPYSAQGDREIVPLLQSFGARVCTEGGSVCVKKAPMRGIDIDASDIPDLVPVLAVLASAAEGETRIYNAARLRYKESDRLSSTAELISSLGGRVTELPDGLVIHGKGALKGGTVSSFGDHRIAMSAAAAACMCSEPVTVTEPECTDKSFPDFWECFGRLETENGKYI